MTENKKIVYPKNNDIKPKCTTFQKSFIIIITIMIFGAFFLIKVIKNEWNIEYKQLLLITGLYLNIIGVIIASVRTPYFGSFYDGGEIEFKRQKANRKIFQKGMCIIGIGFLFQIFASMF